MKKRFHKIILTFTLIVIAFFANIVSANTPIPPPASAPASNTPLPIDIGDTGNQWIKEGPLTVGYFQAASSSQFNTNAYFNGILMGNPIDSTHSTLQFGGVGVLGNVNLVVDGSLQVKEGGLYSIVKASTGTLAPVCADTNGDIVLCSGSSGPSATLTANPASVNSGGSSTLTVAATNFATSVSCSIDHGVGVVSMTANGTDAWQGNVLATNITQTTTYTVNCTGPSGTANAQAQVTVAPMVISGTMTYTCPENNLGQRFAHLDLTFDKPLPAPTKLVFAECSDGAGGFYAKVCEGVRIIPGGLPSGYVDATGIGNIDYTTFNGGWGPWTINIPAGSTSWSSPGTATTPAIWNGDYYPLVGAGELDCESNEDKDERTTVPDRAYLKLVTPTPGWTLNFTGIDHQPDPAKTWSFPVYPVY